MPLNAVAVPRFIVIVIAGLMVLVVATGVAIVSMPHATITVFPVTSQKTVSHTITLSKAAEAPDFVRFVLPARVIEETIDESQTITREVGSVTEDFARGQVTLHNDQADEQPLLPKSHLRHEASGVFFLIDAAVRIPSQGTVTVAVTAKEKGSRGNVPKGKFIVDKLPGSLQAVVYGESQQDFNGGVAGSKPLTEDELNQAKASFRQKVEQRATAALSAAAGGATIRPDLIHLNFESETTSAAAGSLTPMYAVAARGIARGFLIDNADLLSLTVLALRAEAKPEVELATYDPNSFKVAIQRANFERGEATVLGTVNGTFATKMSSAVFEVANLTGRTQAEVEEYFKQFPGVDHVEVTLSPFWVKTVPSRPRAVEVRLPVLH